MLVEGVKIFLFIYLHSPAQRKIKKEFVLKEKINSGNISQIKYKHFLIIKTNMHAYWLNMHMFNLVNV